MLSWVAASTDPDQSTMSELLAPGDTILWGRLRDKHSIDKRRDIRQGDGAVKGAVGIAIGFAAERRFGNVYPINQSGDVGQR